MFYTVKAAVLVIQYIAKLPKDKQGQFNITEADKRWAGRMAKRPDFVLGNPPIHS